MITNAILHYTILNHIIDEGYAPDVDTLAQLLETDSAAIETALYDLQEYHGVVLHPHEPKIWAIHPFSLAPTNFFVKSARGQWWGNCAWCSLGIAALLREDVVITTSLGAHGEKIDIHIVHGKILQDNLFVHFPIPMKKAWDNVVYTCSTMLVFKNEHQVEEWATKHGIPKGDVQPINNIWEFSKTWYGNHANRDWKKWTIHEAKEIFLKFNLKHEIWNLEDDGNKRF